MSRTLFEDEVFHEPLFSSSPIQPRLLQIGGKRYPTSAGIRRLRLERHSQYYVTAQRCLSLSYTMIMHRSRGVSEEPRTLLLLQSMPGKSTVRSINLNAVSMARFLNATGSELLAEGAKEIPLFVAIQTDFRSHSNSNGRSAREETSLHDHRQGTASISARQDHSCLGI